MTRPAGRPIKRTSPRWHVEGGGEFARLTRVDAVVRRAFDWWAFHKAEINIRLDGRHVGTLTYGGFWRTSNEHLRAAIEKIEEDGR